MPILKTLFFFMILAAQASAQSIVVKNFKDAPTPIAVQSFVRGSSDLDTKITSDIEAMFTANLIFSRIFRVIPAEAFLEPDIEGDIAQLNVASWRQVGADYVVRAQASRSGPSWVLQGYVFDVRTGKLVLNKEYKTNRKRYTILAHMFGDDVVKLITGELGLFSTRIAFVYKPPNSRQKEIWSMDFNGRNPTPLIQNGRTNLSPKWDTTGKNIYYTSASTINWHLWRTDERGRSKQITNFAGSALGPTMMPDGSGMVISLSKDGNPELYEIDMNGKVKKRLTKRRTIEIAPSVSPDGKKICYSSGLLGNLHIFVMDLVAGKADRLTRVGTLNDSCSWHPRENRILFSGMDVDREFDIFGMNDQGNDMERLTYDAKNNETPSWSPDGSLVVFSSRRTGRDEVYIMKADGSQISKITDLPGEASQPDWSPRLGYD